MKPAGKLNCNRKPRTALVVILIFLLSVTFFHQTGDIERVVNNYSEVTRVDEGSLSSATKVTVEIASDQDDDYWNLKDSEWTHGTTSTEVFCRQYPAVAEDVAQFRFALPVLKYATINHATISVYEINDNVYVAAWIRRIDETNVGSLEADSVIPKTTTLHQALHIFDDAGSEWVTTDITDIVQDQVNLHDWQNGYHIGLQFNITGIHGTGGWNGFEDFQSSNSHHAYISVTYTATVDWLPGWSYRRSHVMGPADGAGIDYTLPVYVSTRTGTNHDNWVYLGNKVKSDFGDVRFTTNDGTTLLSYWLSETHDEQVTDYVTDAVVDLYSYPHNYPAAYFHNGRTYVVFQGDLDSTGHDLDPHIMYYDHSTHSWSGIHKIGYNPAPLKEPQDDHGPPCMWIDYQGYIHVMYGAHDYNLKHAISDIPEDITSWTLQDDFHVSRDDRLTYPHIGYNPSNDHVYITYRSSIIVPDADPQVYIRSTDGGRTWSDEQIILTSPSHMWCAYPGATTFDPENNLFHIGYRFWNFTAGKFQGIYYLALNVETGHIFNAAGSDLGMSTTLWDPNLLVYDNGPSYPSMYGPDTHIDENGNPYIIFSETGSPRKTCFTYWTGSAWTTPEVISNPGWIGAGHDFIVHSSTNITAFLNDGQDIARYTWNGVTWTYQGEIYDGDELLSHTLVPINYVDEFQVIFSEYEWSVAKHKMAYAWGSNGLLNGKIAKHAKFYVKIPYSLDVHEQAIYVYYGNEGAPSTSQSFAVSEDPWVPHGPWGVEEENSANGPSVDQAPTVSNLDMNGHLYAKRKAYELTLSASDVNGTSSINYMDLTLTSDSQSTDYWTVRYYEGTDTFLEQDDPYDYITLDVNSSTAFALGDTIVATFHLTINWNHPDISSADVRCLATDDQLHSAMNHYEMDWNVETRVELVEGPILEDSSGTSNRGDIDGEILASGSVAYFGSTLSPPASEIDVYIVSPNVQTSPWNAQDYDESSGTFSVVVGADDEVGQEAYRFKVVPKDEGADGTDLLHQNYECTYVADSILATLSVDELSSNETTVCFTISLTYAYDGAQITDFTAVISKNEVEWLAVNQTGFTDERDTVNEITYAIMSVSENTHGLTTVQGPVSPFVWGGDGYRTGSPAANTSLEALMVSLNEMQSLILAIASSLQPIVILVSDEVIYALNDPALFITPEASGAILILVLVSLVSLPITSRLRKHGRVSARKRRGRTFKSLGGLDVYTLLPMSGGQSNLKIIIDGSESSFLVLDTGYERVTERLKFMIAAGEKPKKLLRLYSAPLEESSTDLILLGLIWASGGTLQH